MYKVSILIAQINKTLRLSFNLVVSSETNDNNYYLKLINKFNYLGNDYLKISPHPYISLEIGSRRDKKTEGWSANSTVNINSRGLFSFLLVLSGLIKEFKEYEDLYYYDKNKNLILDKEVASKIEKKLICNNKRIIITPCVVPGDKEGEEYEGCIIYINKIEFYSYITYSEMEYMYYELSKVNMSELSLHLIEVANIYKEEDVSKLEPKEKLIEVKEEEIKSVPYVKIEEPNEIPEI